MTGLYEPKPTVEIILMERVNKSQYFEVWVRSDKTFHNGTRIRNGTIVERDFNAEVKIEIAAGAIAEAICEKWNDTIDPGEVAKLARQAFLELNSENPQPLFGDEAPL